MIVDQLELPLVRAGVRVPAAQLPDVIGDLTARTMTGRQARAQ